MTKLRQSFSYSIYKLLGIIFLKKLYLVKYNFNFNFILLIINFIICI